MKVTLWKIYRLIPLWTDNELGRLNKVHCLKTFKLWYISHNGKHVWTTKYFFLLRYNVFHWYNFASFGNFLMLQLFAKFSKFNTWGQESILSYALSSYSLYSILKTFTFHDGNWFTATRWAFHKWHIPNKRFWTTKILLRRGTKLETVNYTLTASWNACQCAWYRSYK